MKKLYYLIVIVLIFGLVLTGCSLLSDISQVPTTEQSDFTYLTKGVPGDHDIFTLYAGQNIDVGNVEVWNDTDKLYIRYVVTAPWRLTETHLHVAKSLDGIPQTKKGNPKPGKFDYKGEHAYETEVLYEIPLIWESDTELFVAAHAKVVRPINDCDETVWQIGDVETNDCSGDLTNYANEFNWRNEDSTEVGDCVTGPYLGTLPPTFTTPFIVGSTLNDEFPYNSNNNKGYATNIEVQWNGSLPFGGLLTISWSPGPSGQDYEEEKKLSGAGFPSTITFTENAKNMGGTGWFMNKYPLVEHSIAVDPLSKGDHIINFEHTKGNGTFWDWIRLEKPCEQEESAWAVNGEGINSIGSLPFSGANWATYFQVTVTQPDDGNTVVELKDSNGVGLEGGVVQYYSGGWKDFGTTGTDGKVSKDLPDGSYSFQMTYAGAIATKSQNVASDPIVVFNTTLVTMKLLDSNDNELEGGADYYAGGYHTFGSGSTTTTMELLPVSYTFRVSYEGAIATKSQNVASDPIVIFQTKLVTMKLLNSNNNELAGGAEYYAGGYKTFGGGTTPASMELLPVSYTFRVSYAGAITTKSQNVASDPVVVFNTTLVTMKLLNQLGTTELVGGAEYYANGYKTFGNGTTSATMQLLPISYTFRVYYAGAIATKSQNVASDPIVIFQTGWVYSNSKTCTQYYAGGWKTFTDGMDLLPGNYLFRFSDGFPQTSYPISAGLRNKIH